MTVPMSPVSKDHVMSEFKQRVFALLRAIRYAQAVAPLWLDDLYRTVDGVEKETEEQTAALDALDAAWESFNAGIEEMSQLVASHLNAMQALPPDLSSASIQLAQHQVEYERMAMASIDALHQWVSSVEAWRNLDVDSARIKQRVVARLVSEGVSATAAEKQASGDEEYTTHKDKIAAASTAKDWGEFVKDQSAIERTIAFEKVQTSRAFVNSLLIVTQQRVMGRLNTRVQITDRDATRDTGAATPDKPHAESDKPGDESPPATPRSVQ